eukprot:335788-Rhodomonas_salina.1
MSMSTFLFSLNAQGKCQTTCMLSSHNQAPKTKQSGVRVNRAHTQQSRERQKKMKGKPAAVFVIEAQEKIRKNGQTQRVPAWSCGRGERGCGGSGRP